MCTYILILTTHTLCWQSTCVCDFFSNSATKLPDTVATMPTTTEENGSRQHEDKTGIENCVSFPTFCRSAKEQECWSLFKKMQQKGRYARNRKWSDSEYIKLHHSAGVQVAYETLLRGLLTPTEMRSVLKHDDLEAVEPAADCTAGENDDAVKNKGKANTGTTTLALRCT